MNFDFDSLRCFVRFAERLNFTHAAEDLHISQPALFIKIQALSKELGAPIYSKIGRQLQLTEQGEHLLLFARETLRRADSLVGVLTGELSERVVLAAGEGGYLYLLGDAIRTFQRTATMKSNVELELITANREQIIEAIHTGRADLGVASLEMVPHGCVSHVFHVAEQMLVMQKDHRLASKRRISLRDLEGEDLIVPPANRQHRQVLSQALQSAGVNWNVAVEASGWELMMKFVQLGLGVAVINSICTPTRGLVAKPIPDLPNVHYHLFHRKGAACGAIAQLKDLIITTNS